MIWNNKAPVRSTTRDLFILSISVLLVGCSTLLPLQPEPVTARNVDGFSVVEDVRVGVGVRREFEEALIALGREDFESGIEALEAVADEVPNSTTVQVDLAIAYAGMNDLERAEASIERALELNPRHPAALNERAILHRRAGRFEQARESYERALSIYPEFHLARRNLAILCDLYLMDARCALEHYEIYGASVPDDESVAVWIIDLRNRLDIEAES